MAFRPSPFRLAAALALALAAATATAGPARAADPVIPDANLRACANAQLGQPAATPITAAQAASLTSLDCASRGIARLDGIQVFTGLQTLNLLRNKVTNLAGIRFPASLKVLELTYNGITTLSGVTLPAGLLTLDLELNSLTSLAGFTFPAGLTTLDLRSNSIYSLQGVVFPPGLTTAYLVNQTLSLPRVAVGTWQSNPFRLPNGARIVPSALRGRPVTVDPGSGNWIYTEPIDDSEPLAWTAKVAAGLEPVTFSGSIRQSAVSTPAPVVLGVPKIGRTLRAALGAWSLTPSSVQYQWYRSGLAIPGATAATYKPKTADAGRALTVRVIAFQGTGPAIVRTAKAVRVAKIVPRVTVKVTSKSVPARARPVVAVTVKAVGLAKPAGKIQVTWSKGKKTGSKTVALKRSARGKATVTLPKLPTGKHAIKAKFKGTAQIAAKTSKKAVVTIR
ncbi:MAG: Ig-like domain repeat protein [Bifidobacteriaceae bacterium]|nr:Ig-like domain repeat protein [Bifidobacteriaceae bacterium]